MFDELATQLISSLPRNLVYRVARRYIAGLDAASAVARASHLQQSGFVTTIARLGEEATNGQEANQATRAILTLMDEMAAASIDRNVSIKLTSLGLRLGKRVAFDNMTRILARADEKDFFIRIDMEDSSVTDITIEFYQRALEVWPRVGIVLQSRLKRTVADAADLANLGANIRVVKGIYLEPPPIAWQEPEAVDESFMETLGTVLRRGGYGAIATHDKRLIERIEREFENELAQGGNAEFQALLGVPFNKTLNRLRDAGYPVRLYLPFGEDWWAYSRRRLRENPKLFRYIVKDFFSERKFS